MIIWERRETAPIKLAEILPRKAGSEIPPESLQALWKMNSQCFDLSGESKGVL